jgi:hypothetical protein
MKAMGQAGIADDAGGEHPRSVRQSAITVIGYWLLTYWEGSRIVLDNASKTDTKGWPHKNGLSFLFGVIVVCNNVSERFTIACPVAAYRQSISVTPAPRHPHLAVIQMDPANCARFERTFEGRPEVRQFGVDHRSQPDHWTAYVASASRSVRDLLESNW